MTQTRTAREEWQLACKAEREAWDKVQDHQPGDPGHDPEAWKRWQTALRRASAAMKRLDQESGSEVRPA
jgi:hypothetical protein